MAAKIAGSNPVAHPKIMDQEFITIAEAARLTGQSDVAIMRAIKDCLQQPGVNSVDILKKEPRDNDFIYLVNRKVLLGEFVKEKAPEREQEPSVAPSTPLRASEGNEKETQKPEQTLLEVKNEMIAMLQKVVGTQEGQIGDLSKKIDQLIERDRETNILLKTLHDKLFLLSAKGENKKPA